MEPQAIGQAIQTLGPFGIIICFIIYLVLREKRQEKTSNGTDKTTLQSLAAAQETMAQTIGLIEKHGSVPFQVHVAETTEKYKNLSRKVDGHETRLNAQSDRLDVIHEGATMTTKILTDVIEAHNRIHPDRPVYGSGGG